MTGNRYWRVGNAQLYYVENRTDSWQTEPFDISEMELEGALSDNGLFYGPKTALLASSAHQIISKAYPLP